MSVWDLACVGHDTPAARLVVIADNYNELQRKEPLQGACGRFQQAMCPPEQVPLKVSKVLEEVEFLDRGDIPTIMRWFEIERESQPAVFKTLKSALQIGYWSYCLQSGAPSQKVIVAGPSKGVRLRGAALAFVSLSQDLRSCLHNEVIGDKSHARPEH